MWAVVVSASLSRRTLPQRDPRWPRHPLSPEAKHHVDPYERDFCIMSGLCNRPLNVAAGLFGVRSHGWILVFLLTCTVPIGAGLAMHYGGV